ncbi:copper radical oxidase [Dothidotthia symphoricarpi CBS 119687]|uniref:Copper radical oxidase n=1 Tax=Dothidotthia symphoricarpi CBS 119687 TaxID=1392245 RepID=A0A6A6A4B1_9PLEO|nr:copper radical oxidase [Dothidotthia symphoricarpi CBS 119687]KAF2126386.1 copper radical oxidase [Dothidotthia symphoricarpi CBS 119687]
MYTRFGRTAVLLTQIWLPTTLAQALGTWSEVINFPVIPVGAYVVPEAPSSFRMMVYSAWSPNSFGGERGYTQFAEFNFNTGTVSERQVSNTNHDMFCPGMNSLSDGRLIITGGSNAEKTSIYDPATNQFASGADMNIKRGYQASALLSNGKVFTIGGSWSGPLGGKMGEIYNPTTNTWTVLPGAAVEPMLTNDKGGIFHQDNHAWLFPWKNGSVLQAGPSKAMNWYYTDGTGGVSPAGIRDADNDAMCGVNVMYDVGKIFSAGGSHDYGDSPALSVGHLISISDVGAPATVEQLPDMHHKRAFANVVVLPDGKSLITGGQEVAHGFTDDEAVLEPELFDPVTKNYTLLAPATIPRNYHSTSLLLPDGRVFSGGGGLCYDSGAGESIPCHNTADHPNAQIFTPPYLTTGAPRPVISQVVEGLSVAPGGQIKITMEGSTAGVTFALLRIGSSTHSLNTDQRRIPLTPQLVGDNDVTLPVLGDSGIMLPGAWYLFAVSAAGVPSVARTIFVTL